MNPRPLGYEPNELPDCSTPRHGRKRFIVSDRKPLTKSELPNKSAIRELRSHFLKSVSFVSFVAIRPTSDIIATAEM